MSLRGHPYTCCRPAARQPGGGGPSTAAIRIVIHSMSGDIPTALAALTVENAERLCDRLNARLVMDREAWTPLAARSMGAGNGAPDDETVH